MSRFEKFNIYFYLNLLNFNLDSWQQLSIKYEYDNTRQNLVESENFDVKKFTQDICDNSDSQGLNNEHSNNLRDLVLIIKSYSTADLLKLYQESQTKCNYARYFF